MSKDVKVSFRVTPEELELLHKKAAASKINCFKNDEVNFSEFIRQSLFTAVKYKNKELNRNVAGVRMELRKIGVNINQITKKINAGFGECSDMENLKSQLILIEQLLDQYTEEVSKAWQSQS